MFKTSFSKYITAFVLIIFLSFLMLSGIITSMIRGYVNENTKDKLVLAAEIISDELVGIDTHKPSSETLNQVIVPFINFDAQYNVMITDENGKIILTTLGKVTEGELKEPKINTEEGFGNLSVSSPFFEVVTNDNGESLHIHRGNLNGLLSENSLVYAKELVSGGKASGYVLTLASLEKEVALVEITRSAVINSSIWVMLAAVIAIYFITERIIHPLKTMTGASKKFAKGDFSARVTVYGNDEVAELGRAFNNMAESLDSLEKMRNSFLANISHDLRTPMTTIAGFIDGINSGAIPPEKHEYYLGVISAEVHRLSRLVSQILDVSRLESGERKFTFTDFDIAEMARIILISFEQKIDSKKLDVSFEAEDDELYVNADKDAIYQVLYNLCHNALKFSRDGGKYEISLKRIQGKKIQVSVFDEGQSISNEDAKMIFDRFYKTDKSRGLDKTGVGLGLYISKTIIDAHEEKIWVESEEGVSTTFSFTLKEGSAPAKNRQSAIS